MTYASLTTYLFTISQKTFSSCEPKDEWPHAGLYNYNGMFQCCLSIENSNSVSLSFEAKLLHRMNVQGKINH